MSIEIIGVDTSENALLLGNFEKLLFFGTAPQNRIRDLSKKISESLLTGKTSTEDIINNVIIEINNFSKKESIIDGLDAIFNRFIKSEKEFEYKELLNSITNLTTSLQLQQVQLIKEKKLFEKLEVLMKECYEELNTCIGIGEQYANNVNSGIININIDKAISDKWLVSLEKRLNDLRLSRTIALQSEAQMRLMSENNITLLEKINSTLTNTIPIWRNQAALLYEMERYKNNIVSENKLNKETNQYIKKESVNSTKNLKKVSISKQDKEKIINANSNLNVNLNSLVNEEKERDSINNKLISILNNEKQGESI